MPFDAADYPALPRRRAGSRTSRRLVGIWLLVVCAMILVMVVLGGVTRLTGSGLSIMEWAPVTGALPPLNDADWRKLFALYKTIPQYHLLHEGMGLAGFKGLFWLEWVHRLWGRLIGVVFLIPLVALAVTGRIDRRLVPRLVVIFLLGGLQGAVGWFMVASGFFPDSVAVEPARLVVHLVLALALYAAILWTALTLLRPPLVGAGSRVLRGLAWALALVLALTIVAGGFTAGTHAGLAYNTFPLMDGQLVPPGYARLDPFALNLIANIAAVQFDHRVLATLTAALALGVAWAALAHTAAKRVRVAALVALGFIALQYALGVATLLFVVPIPLAAAHQANAVLALTATIVLLAELRAPARALISRGPRSQESP